GDDDAGRGVDAVLTVPDRRAAAHDGVAADGDADVEHRLDGRVEHVRAAAAGVDPVLRVGDVHRLHVERPLLVVDPGDAHATDRPVDDTEVVGGVLGVDADAQAGGVA